MQQCLHENLAVSVSEHPDLMLLDGSRGGVIRTSDDKVGDRSTSQAGSELYPPPLVRIETRLDALDFPCRPLLMSGRDSHDFPLRTLYGNLPYMSTCDRGSVASASALGWLLARVVTKTLSPSHCDWLRRLAQRLIISAETEGQIPTSL